MKKRLEAELISIAHRVLKLKNRSETIQLQEEARKLYEQLTILRFYEENFEMVGKEMKEDAFEEKLENYVVNDQKEQVEIKEDENLITEIERVKEEGVKDEKEIEQSNVLKEEKIADEDLKEASKEGSINSQNILFDEILASDFQEIDFVKVEDAKVVKEKTVSDSQKEVALEEKKQERQEVVEKKTHTTDESKSFSLNDKLTKGINIGLNDRIAFEKKLFGGSPNDYNRVISQLNTLNSFEEAREFINTFVKPDYNNWEGKEDYEIRFLEIIERKFS